MAFEAILAVFSHGKLKENAFGEQPKDQKAFPSWQPCLQDSLPWLWRDVFVLVLNARHPPLSDLHLEGQMFDMSNLKVSLV